MIRCFIEKSYATIKLPILWLSLMIFMVFILFVLPQEVQRSEHYFGDSQVPDTSFFYTGEALDQMAQDFGQEGRAYYIRSRATFDVVWPLGYGFFLWAALAYFGKAVKETVFRYTLLLPIIGVFFDFLENTGASVVMVLYPEKVPWLLFLVPIFTLSKWIVIGMSFIALLMLILYQGYQRITDH